LAPVFDETQRNDFSSKKSSRKHFSETESIFLVRLKAMWSAKQRPPPPQVFPQELLMAAESILNPLVCRFWRNPGDFYVVAPVDMDVIFFVLKVIGVNCDGFDTSLKTQLLSFISNMLGECVNFN
jgi:hypothetical protein